MEESGKVFESATNSAKVRIENRRLVLEILHLFSPISRSEIADLTGLTRAAVTNIIKELSDVGLIEEVGRKDTPLGRKKQLLRIKKDAFYILGVEISRDRLRAGLFNSALEMLSMEEKDIDVEGKREEVLTDVLEMVERVVKRGGVRRSRIFGLGVGIPGVVDHEEGVVLSSPAFKDFNMLNLKEVFEKKFKIRTWIDNDANVSALGEKWKGKEFRNFIYVIADLGLGGGIIINGSLFRGSLKGIGEIGSIPVRFGRRLVSLEQLTSIRNLERRYEEESGKRKSAVEIIDMALSGERIARKILKSVVGYVAMGIAAAVNMISPQAVVFGGRLSRAGEFLIKGVKRVMDRFVLSPEKPKLFISDIQDRAEIIGAAALVLENLVSRPYELILQGASNL